MVTGGNFVKSRTRRPVDHRPGVPRVYFSIRNDDGKASSTSAHDFPEPSTGHVSFVVTVLADCRSTSCSNRARDGGGTAAAIQLEWDEPASEISR